MKGRIGDVATHFPHSIGVDIPVEKAMEMMKKYDCHHLPVLDGGTLVGIVSSRDLNLIGSIPEGIKMNVGNLMTEDPVIVDPDENIDDCIKRMLSEKVGSLIVSAKNGQAWAIFTTTDALKLLVST